MMHKTFISNSEVRYKYEFTDLVELRCILHRNIFLHFLKIRKILFIMFHFYMLLLCFLYD